MSFNTYIDFTTVRIQSRSITPKVPSCPSVVTPSPYPKPLTTTGLFSFFLFCNKFIYLFIYLFLAALGLRCCARAFSGCGERGLVFVAVHGLLIVVASLVVEDGL